MTTDASAKSITPATSQSEAADRLISSLLARSWIVRLAAASALIAVLWIMILWGVSLP
jgi:hypothetical protein